MTSPSLSSASPSEPVEFLLHDLSHRVGSLGVVTEDVRRRLETPTITTLRQVLPATPGDDPRHQAAQALLEVLEEERRLSLEDLALIRLQVRHLRHVLRRSLALAQVGPVSLLDVIDEAVALADVERHGIEVRCDRPTLPPWHGDGWTLLRILLALLDNARAAMADLPAPGMIHIVVAPHGDRFTISLTDTGRGWSTEGGPQPDGPRSAMPGAGSGLGLVSCRERVRALLGDLRWTSPGPGRGATFILELPGGSP